MQVLSRNEAMVMMDHDDRPIPQYLKVVYLLDVQAGRADVPGTGEQIAILTFGHLAEVEQPVMVNMRDTHRLAVKLLAVLAHHGDETAMTVLQQHYGVE